MIYLDRGTKNGGRFLRDRPFQVTKNGPMTKSGSLFLVRPDQKMLPDLVLGPFLARTKTAMTGLVNNFSVLLVRQFLFVHVRSIVWFEVITV